ncbi:MAG: hypothetical protein HKN29_03080 [Rhodothermales bacterium]|nr:hypothetical protein [Rhodothermales bacterium]
MRPFPALVLLLVLVAAVPDSLLKDLYESGQSYAAFLEDAERRKAMWEANTEKAGVPEDLLERAAAVGGTWHLLVIAVDGCSDSANVIPYLAALTDAVDGLEMRIVDSTQGRALMNAHRTPDGRAATPTVLLLDSAFNNAGAFIERPAPLQEWAMTSREELGDAEYLTQKLAWYDEDMGRTTLVEMIEILETASAER